MSAISTSRSVRTIIVHYRTPGLLKAAVESFRVFYPDVPLTIVDNGSSPEEVVVVRELAAAHPAATQVMELGRNVFHGPAMHTAAQAATEEFLFFLDSDTVTQRGGYLEAMSELLKQNDPAYGAGKIATVNKRGFHDRTGTPILVAPYMMVRRSMYRQLAPFEHHGAPTLNNFVEAHSRGWTLSAFPVDEYIDHLGRGTAGLFGYGLGLRGKIDFVLNKFGL